MEGFSYEQTGLGGHFGGHPGGVRRHGGHAACGNYVDDNGDGVCDNCGTACRHAACGNYVDDNGDGVCDNIGAGGGCHAHHGGRSGHCHGNK